MFLKINLCVTLLFIIDCFDQLEHHAKYSTCKVQYIFFGFGNSRWIHHFFIGKGGTKYRKQTLDNEKCIELQKLNVEVKSDLFY